MKTIFAKEKSEYLHHLIVAINLNLSEETRIKAIKRMTQLESLVKEKNDELQIVVTTVKTNTMRTAPPMSMEDIKKEPTE